MSKAEFKPVAIGRPRSEAAVSHAAIMDAVYGLLKEKPARDLTMDAVAKRAGVGKPTLYKWWPSKAAHIIALTKTLRIRNEAIKSLYSSVRRFRDATIKEECKGDYPHALQALWKALDRAEDLIQN